VQQKSVWTAGLVRHAWPLEGLESGREEWLIELTRGLALFDGVNLTPLRFTLPLTERPLAISALPYDEERPPYLLSTATQLWLPSLEEGLKVWELSPISADVGGAWSMSATGLNAESLRLWLLNEEGLSVWGAGALTRFGWVSLEGVTPPAEGEDYPPRTAQLIEVDGLTLPAEMSSAEPAHGLWIEADERGSPSELTLISEETLWRHPSWRSEIKPCVSGRGVWGAREGQLWGGPLGASWEPIELMSGDQALRVERVWCHRGDDPSEGSTETLWLLAEGALWRAMITPEGSTSAEQLRAVALTGRWTGGVMNTQGALNLWGEGGLISLETQLSASWLASEGVTLNERPHEFTLSLDAPSAVTELRWGVRSQGGEEALVEAPLDPANPLITLSNLDLTEGVYELYAEVRYGDSDLFEATLTINSQRVTTWSEDISPLHQARCATCHSGTGARDLSDAQRWLNDIDDILLVTRMQSMPIGAPPLTAEEIDLIERWKLAGGLE